MAWCMKFLPTMPEEFARPCGNEFRFRIQKQARSAYPIARNHHHASQLLVNIALPIEIEGAGRATLRVQRDFTHP